MQGMKLHCFNLGFDVPEKRAWLAGRKGILCPNNALSQKALTFLDTKYPFNTYSVFHDLFYCDLCLEIFP